MKNLPVQQRLFSPLISGWDSHLVCALGLVFLALLVGPTIASAQNPFDNPFAPPPVGPPAAPATSERKEDVEPGERPRPTNNVPVADAATTDKPLPPDFIILYLMDGSVIAGRLSTKEIAVETQFGNLSVPVENIKSITPGLQSHPALAKEVNGLIADLGSGNYNDREKAQQALIKMGPAVRGELERHQNDNDVERRNRVKAVLTEFDQLTENFDTAESPDALTSLRQGDTIETTEFTIVGKIVPQSFAVKSPYGELNVKLADIRRGERDLSKKEDVRQSFTVDASHLATRGALNTNLRIQRGDVVTVTADGTITMTPWGNNAVTTPDGAQNYGWFIPGQIPSGALVGKIGNDNFTKLGSKATFTAERSGVLQLAIGMQADYSQNQFPGKYSVKVRVQRKEK
jgi:hypothetical protein